MQLVTVSQAARRWHIPPRLISDLFYARRLDDARCPIVGGRRLIPADYLGEVERVLRTAGHLATPAEEAAPCPA
jgi:hypothetical protein